MSEQNSSIDFIKKARALHGLHFGHVDANINFPGQVWSKWCAFVKNENHALLELLTNKEINDTYKARALVVLLSPNISLSPFPWANNQASAKRKLNGLLRDFDFATLSRALQKFLFQLLPLCMKATPDADKESGHKADESVPTYHKAIIFALSVLAEDDPLAEELFQLWQPLDPVVYWNMDFASGYDQLRALLQARIPSSWKKKAHERMVRIILSENAGKTQPRADHEDARRCYLYQIELCIIGGRALPYAVDLLAEQVEFLIGPGDKPGARGIQVHTCKYFLNLLSEVKFLDLRRRFARYIVLGDHCEFGPFSVHHDDEMKMARQMLEEADEEDKEMKERLGFFITQGQTRLEKKRSNRTSRKAKNNAILSQMRV
ncbi:hypothetical protein H6784_04805 [Candidatus Nomurabacteria bacterium]|nr:hypothetical protein [Candidatus Kaiserbacteria bacterium]MCB9814709.1 hypothetical protein [Candidatus Nomurabacteria bacterium]